MEKKEYKTIEEQIKYLVESKKVDPTTIDENAFNEKTYLSLITPYTDLVAIGRDANKNHIYKENTNFNEYLSWVKIDKYISVKLQNAIGFFENKLKLFLANKVCQMMHANGDKSCCEYSVGFTNYLSGIDYLNFLPLFSDEDEKASIIKIEQSSYDSRTKAINTILKIDSVENRSNIIIKHYRDKGYIPFWVLVHALTINELAHVYRMLKYSDKYDFLKNYLNLEKVDNRVSFKFSNLLSDISRMRNTINHYEPIIPLITQYKIENFNLLINAVSLVWKIYKNSNEYYELGKEPIILTAINDHNKKNINKIKRVLDVIK